MVEIPTHNELISRATLEVNRAEYDNRLWSKVLADFALAEIRRAVREELESLRSSSFGCADSGEQARGRAEVRFAISARLAALRQAEQGSGDSAPTEKAPSMGLAGRVLERREPGSIPGAMSAGREADGNSGETKARATTGAHGAEESAADSGTPASGSTDEGDTMNFGGAEGRAASSPCPPPALSDADVLDKALAIVKREESRAIGQYTLISTWQELEKLAAKLRAPKPVDVFRAFFEAACAAQDAAGESRVSWNVGDYARDWFGPLVAYVRTMAARPCVQPGKDCGFCDSCEARLDMAALLQRAEEASRG